VRGGRRAIAALKQVLARDEAPVGISSGREKRGEAQRGKKNYLKSGGSDSVGALGLRLLERYTRGQAEGKTTTRAFSG